MEVDKISQSCAYVFPKCPGKVKAYVVLGKLFLDFLKRVSDETFGSRSYVSSGAMRNSRHVYFLANYQPRVGWLILFMKRDLIARRRKRRVWDRVCTWVRCTHGQKMKWWVWIIFRSFCEKLKLTRNWIKYLFVFANVT